MRTYAHCAAWVFLVLASVPLRPFFKLFALVMLNTCELPQLHSGTGRFWMDRQMDNVYAHILCVLVFLGRGRQNLLNQPASLCLREEGQGQVRGRGHSVDRCGWRRTGAGHWGSSPRFCVELGVGGPQPLRMPLPRFPTFPPQVCGAFEGGQWLIRGGRTQQSWKGFGPAGSHGRSWPSLLASLPFFLYKSGTSPAGPSHLHAPPSSQGVNSSTIPLGRGRPRPTGNRFSPLNSVAAVKPRVRKASADIFLLPGQTDRQAKTHPPRPGAPPGLRPAFSLDSWKPDCGS